MVRKGLTGAVALLVVFHAGLLVGQAWKGQLLDPGLLFRWLIAGGVVYAFIALHRQGQSILFGRRPVAIWLLAALLHGPAVASRIESFEPQAVPEVLVTLSQTALASIAALGLGLLLALGRLRRALPALRPLSGAPAFAPVRSSSYAARSYYGPRPPPR